ncbi:MAG: hypothetical protein HQ506_03015 [Candidatus Marinimicrobia bacterium]|nr:hypothetical protein [Candidatus Neomarinimicrobiota bacterium]
MSKSKKYLRHLKSLGIPLSDFHFYWQIFVGYSYPYWKMYDEKIGVRTALGKNKQAIPLNEYEVLNHLLGKHWVFVQHRKLSPLFCIDIDFKAPNFLKRYSQVVNVLPNPLLFRSSSSRGLHLYYLLKSSLPAKKIHILIKALFKEHDLVEQSGRIEIFPGIIDHLRLPLGEGSCLLDSESLKPLELDLYDSIGLIMDHPRIEIPDVRSQDKKDPTQNRRVQTRNGSRIEKAQCLLETGIREVGTRHAAQLLLIQYFMIDLGYSGSETEEKMLEWLQGFPHISDDWRNTPEKVELEVIALIKNFEGKVQQRSDFKFEPLSVDDVRNIINSYYDFQPWGAEQFRQQDFVFNLLSWYKGQDLKVIDLAFNFVRKLGGASQKTASRRVHYCEELGLLKKVRNHDRLKGRSRQFVVNFNFNIGAEATSLSGGIRKLFTKREINKMYSRSVARKITVTHAQEPIKRA